LPLLNYQGNTYVPLKAVGDVLEANVKWNEHFKRVEIGEIQEPQTYQEIDAELIMGEPKTLLKNPIFDVNGKVIKFDYSIKDGQISVMQAKYSNCLILLYCSMVFMQDFLH
jgi:hypothetical protein